MQARCPNCGNYWTMPVSTPPQGVWRTLAILWLVLCLLAAAIFGLAALQVGGSLGWSIAWFPIALLIFGCVPLFIVQIRNDRRNKALGLWQCRSCGFEWTP